jgi:hypothetical protein
MGHPDPFDLVSFVRKLGDIVDLMAGSGRLFTQTGILKKLLDIYDHPVSSTTGCPGSRSSMFRALACTRAGLCHAGACDQPINNCSSAKASQCGKTGNLEEISSIGIHLFISSFAVHSTGARWQSQHTVQPMRRCGGITELLLAGVTLHAVQHQALWNTLCHPPQFWPDRRQQDLVTPLIEQFHMLTARISAAGSTRSWHPWQDRFRHVAGGSAVIPDGYCYKQDENNQSRIILPLST